MALDACRPGTPIHYHQPKPSAASTPLLLHAWEVTLANHPDHTLSKYVLAGIEGGFRIGFSHSHWPDHLRSSRRNMGSATANPVVVQSYIDKEVNAGRLVLSDVPDTQVHISSFGVIPKRHQPGKWRLIVDLSAPQGYSVNDGISEALCSLKYPSVHDGAQLAMQLGKGALMAKIDLQNAYRILPIHPDDRKLLGVRWNGRVYVDAALPFGLRSAPKIFKVFADCLMWVMQQEGIQHVIHYLDDFLFAGHPATGECAASLAKALEVCTQLGMPVAPHKIEGPSTKLTFLGIEIDSQEAKLRLPEQKLLALRSEIVRWRGLRRCSKRNLQSLLGSLNHAASVVGPGRTFMRGLVDLLPRAKAPHHKLRLNAEARADLLWWDMFINQWNGVSTLPQPAPSHHVYTDASGSWGCGAVWSSKWLQLSWPEEWASENIAVKELVPFVAAAAMWGTDWKGCTIQFHCDNMAIVRALSAGRAKFPPINRLLRCLSFFSAHFNFRISAVHIRGYLNDVADAISRNLSVPCNSQIGALPQAIPPELQAILLEKSLQWSSQCWKTLFDAFLIRD